MQVWKDRKSIKTCENSENEAEEVKFEEVENLCGERREYVDVQDESEEVEYEDCQDESE